MFHILNQIVFDIDLLLREVTHQHHPELIQLKIEFAQRTSLSGLISVCQCFVLIWLKVLVLFRSDILVNCNS